jgi:RNA polymerase sigma-70 factor (ECF subfamily)
MLGSVHDAEDQVQETLLRAWRAYDQFEGQSSLRTWLYRIATNTCLRALETRSRRPLPTGLGAPSDNPDRPLEAVRTEIPWLEPFPDTLLGVDPAAVVTSRSSMRLALIAALQYLPPRQRAVLILRDVLQWRAAEVAELLGVTPVAVNSLLQRAREGLRDAAPVQDEISEPDDAALRALLDRYAAAFQAADVAGLMRLLRADAVLEMPPYPTWFVGSERIGRFLAIHVFGVFGVFGEQGLYRLVPVSANGQPAFAGYRRAADGSYHAHMLEVLTCTPAGIARITNFTDPRVFTLTGLPQALT